MKLSYNHLKYWLKFKQTPEELASLIDLHITEVEELTPLAKYPGVVVGKILEITPHPNADKLRLTVVDIGAEKLRIVCGGQNIEVGQKVPVATVGATLPNGMTIGEAVIRGEESHGMLCSETELGLPPTLDGVLVLGAKTKVGISLDEALGGGETDYSIEIKVLSNRPDYMSYFSLARELAAVLKVPFTPPIEVDYTPVKFKTRDYLKLSIKDKAACERYVGRVVRNVVIKDSPEWMKSVLNAAGMRPINNIVDIANYVMLESGHPIHIFDYNRLGSTEIMVRFAKEGESLFCLDGETRKLDAETAIIADLKQPLAIAGIIGGGNSGVSESTVDIVIEVANFDRLNIRRTARKYGLRTEASSRFERGIDLLDSENIMARILNLIHIECPEADIFDGDLDIHEKLPAASRTLKVSVADINRLVGVDIEGAVMAEILTRLNLSTDFASGGELHITVPHYRHDIQTMPDIAEEILRLHGSDKIPNIMPTGTLLPAETPKVFELTKLLKHQLMSLGLTEVQTHAFTTATKGAVALENPLTENWTHLKTSLLPSLFGLELGRGEAQVFEINNVFQASKEVLPTETKQLAVRVSGKDAYRKARGVMEWVLSRLHIDFETNEQDGGSGLAVKHGKAVMGDLVAYSDKTAGFVLDLTQMSEVADPISRYVESWKFPAVKMDMAFRINPGIRVGDMIEAIRKVSPLVFEVTLFDDFMMPEGDRSVAFHISLRSPEATLTNEVRDEVHGKIKAVLAKTAKASLRE